MFEVYAIKSLVKPYIYVGLTDNFDRRFKQHNAGRSRATKPYVPFALLHKEECVTRIEARQREKYLKSGIGKEYLKTL